MNFATFAEIVYDRERNQQFQTRRIFGEALREAMDKKRVSQTELSIKLEIPVTSISSWLTGRSFPRPKAIVRLNKLLGEMEVERAYWRFQELQMNSQNPGKEWDLLDLLLDRNVLIGGRALSIDDKKRLAQIAELVFRGE